MPKLHGTLLITHPTAVVYGEGVAERAVREAVSELGVSRVLLMTSPTVSTTAAFSMIVNALGPRCVDVFDQVHPHSPRDVVLAAADRFRSGRADAVVSVGGGSVTDSGKALRLAVALAIDAPDGFDRIDEQVLRSTSTVTAPQIALPTTLSGAEFSNAAGVTNPATHQKHVLAGPTLSCRVTVLDPVMTESTPSGMWISGALKVLSDAMELLIAPELSALVGVLAERAATLLSSELRSSKPTDLDGRLRLLLASWMTCFTLIQSGSRLGLATALRHVLAPAIGAPHAALAAVVMPYAYNFNSVAIDPQRHALVAASLGLPDDGADPGLITEELLSLTAKAPVSRLRSFATIDQLTTLSDAVVEAVSRTNNPRRDITSDDVADLLRTAY